MEERRYSLRKRKAPSPSTDDDALHKLLDAAAACSRMVIFTGSGLSASSGTTTTAKRAQQHHPHAGMSTFSTPGGLYERAQKQFGLQDGKKLFCYSFFDRQRLDVQPFFADIYDEALRARAAPGHRAIAAILGAGKLLRHYTLNIDGLAAVVGMDTWHPDNNPDGITVEMHGSIRQLVCPSCDAVCDITDERIARLRARRPLECGACGAGVLRWRVMMYDDAESESITPEGVMDMLDTDMEIADCVLWVGLSFEQSATTSYFRRVRSALAAAGRFAAVPQFLVNPSDEALWNLLSSCSNQGEVEVTAVIASSDSVLPKVGLAAGTTAVAVADAEDDHPGCGHHPAGPVVSEEEQPGAVIKPETPQLDPSLPLDGLQQLGGGTCVEQLHGCCQQACDRQDDLSQGPWSLSAFNMTVFGQVPRRKRD